MFRRNPELFWHLSGNVRGNVPEVFWKSCAMFQQCSEKDLDTLQVACFGHTVHRPHADITVATCWDADRLDLPRLGITPAPHKLCTQAAKNRNLIGEATRRAEAWRDKRVLYQLF